ncbi:hypothetical protein D3C86_1630060 [compost metagenome]
MSKRASSCAISINPANGKYSSAPVIMAVIALSGAAMARSICSKDVLQKRFRYSSFLARISCVSWLAGLTSNSTFLLIGTFTSARILRTERIPSIKSSISRTASGASKAAFSVGQAASVIVSPTCGKCCQISSEMNGMNG